MTLRLRTARQNTRAGYYNREEQPCSTHRRMAGRHRLTIEPNHLLQPPRHARLRVGKVDPLGPSPAAATAHASLPYTTFTPVFLSNRSKRLCDTSSPGGIEARTSGVTLRPETRNSRSLGRRACGGGRRDRDGGGRAQLVVPLAMPKTGVATCLATLGAYRLRRHRQHGLDPGRRAARYRSRRFGRVSWLCRATRAAAVAGRAAGQSTRWRKLKTAPPFSLAPETRTGHSLFLQSIAAKPASPPVHAAAGGRGDDPAGRQPRRPGLVTTPRAQRGRRSVAGR